MSADDTPINISSEREEAGSNETRTETCPFPRCGVTSRRPQELERHIRGHLPNFIYCEQPGCKWTGNRRYTLKNHLIAKHSGIPMPKLEAFLIYDAKGLVKRLLNKDINVERAVGEAQSLFEVQLGKLGRLSAGA